MTFRNKVVPAARAAGQPCPCCRGRTLHGRGQDEICPVCGWHDDGQDDHDAELVRGGANGLLSLAEARRNYARCGVSDPTRASSQPGTVR